MTRNVRLLLDQIDAVLADGGQDGADLWAILTALRGPDNDDDDLKCRTTLPVRAVALPKLREAVHWGLKSRWPSGRFPGMPDENTEVLLADPKDIEAEQLEDDGGMHFSEHYGLAYLALTRKD